MLKGMKCSPETIEKMRISAILRGPLSPEARKRQAESMRRRMQKKENCPMYGRHHTEEAKAKMSATRIGKYKGVNSTWFGKAFSPEHREKLRLAHLGMKQTDETKRKRRRLIPKRSVINGEAACVAMRMAIFFSRPESIRSATLADTFFSIGLLLNLA